ncbi:MAG: hypothetical protein HY881_19040 [Deltaproteobacteria bacterium]|nr:hypothetical protein [Deltaproteobacteria bacterium]
MKKIFTFVPLIVLGLTLLSEVVIDVASAFDYEHPEQLSTGDCWVTLSDGRMVIRSGRECPRPQPKAEAPQAVSEPFWNNTGGSSFGDSYDSPYGGQKGSWQTSAAGVIAGNGNAAISSTTEIPLDSSYPYSHSYGQHYKGGYHGRDDYNRSLDNAGFKNGYPVHPEIPSLPADQRIFQEMHKNLYPGLNNKTNGP